MALVPRSVFPKKLIVQLEHLGNSHSVDTLSFASLTLSSREREPLKNFSFTVLYFRKLALLSAAMNLPNILTLARIPMMFVIVGLMRVDFQGAASMAFVLFVLAGLTDWADGYYARKLNKVSNFGILMDALSDKILMLGLMIALVETGKVAIFLVLLILGRELMITGLRLVAATKGVVMSAESAGKQKTVTQILAVGAFLVADIFTKDLAGLEATWVGTAENVFYWLGKGLFWLCVVMTLYSGVGYFKKYGALAFSEDDKQ